MPFNEETTRQIRVAGTLFSEELSEKKMFGGIAFLYKGKMAIGVVKDDLVVRVLSAKMDSVLKEDHVRPMDFTGKPMKEFIFVSPGGFGTEEQLSRWMELGLEHAKSKL
ncbi:TfoX/Sxy family protein [Flagellimonas meishanensis]|uniref:TfoX/Sxy family protein n=1 Tax=Flagellimonas meishanensis TaxID=2873264 RepID=UPI001CA62CB2|nr:TfoX/Sxy family protein [[Muricauda] meishanensis]